MTPELSFFKDLLAQHNFEITDTKVSLIEQFAEENKEELDLLNTQITLLVDTFKLRNRVKDINDQWMAFPNATVGKSYENHIDIKVLGWHDIVYTNVYGLENTGLTYNNETEVISGMPENAGDFNITFEYRLKGENEKSALNQKKLNFIVNPNPRSLWKDIPSDTQDSFWKEDNIHEQQNLGDRTFIVASKRGRSHANVGSFRDDDYAYNYMVETGWTVICVADGAGSAPLARQGSRIACEAIINYFETVFTSDHLDEFGKTLEKHSIEKQNEESTDETSKSISTFVLENLSNAARFAHDRISEFATKMEKPIKDFHSTLIFTLVKKYEFGNAILTFGVGDCPIGLLNNGASQIKLMNWLDVGEFGGGTRFITMPEIFESTKYNTRFAFTLKEDFDYLMLMTDGIYDPKFIVEANLEKIEKWQEFLADLKGNNEEGIAVSFDPEDNTMSEKLSLWMDFWSPGNHDDRTLAILF